MVKMRVIGLTGGIGSGKSTVSQYLAELGAVVVDADKVGHEAFKPDTPAWRDVVATFGREVLAPKGEVDRKKLGEVVFNDPEALSRLNRIMHPRMYDMMKERIEEYRKNGVAVVVIEAAVLIEANWIPLVDEVWVTVVPEAMVLERIKLQRGLAEEQTLARIRAQISQEERSKHADVIITNDGNPDELRVKVKDLWQNLDRKG